MQAAKNPESDLKAIVHIGDGKCGSSSIQSSLFAARDRLLAQGVLYNAPEKTGGHFSYVTLVDGSTREESAEISEMARANVLQTRELMDIHRPETILLSGESLFHIKPLELIGLLSSIIGNRKIELHIVAYLRHPVPLYLSRVQQGLKGSRFFHAPVKYRRDISSTFERWLAEPDCRSVTARLFDRKSLVGGSVVPDFADYLQNIVGLPSVPLDDVTENSSLSGEQTILLQRFRQDFLPDYDDRLMPQSNRLIRFLVNLNACVGKVGTPAALLPEVQACIAARNMPFTAKLDRMFPSLGMAASFSVPDLAWEDAAPNWTDDVASILVPTDQALVNAFQDLVPEYNSDLLRGDVASALDVVASITSNRAALRVFAHYMNACNLVEAAEATKDALKTLNRIE